MGMERVMLLWQEGLDTGRLSSPDVYLVHQGEKAQPFAFRVGEEIRSAGFSAVFHCGGGSFKSQMKKADASGAAYAVIVGDDEVASGKVALKSLREGGEQIAVTPEELAGLLADRLYGAEEAQND